jgi:hypothetical protein
VFLENKKTFRNFILQIYKKKVGSDGFSAITAAVSAAVTAAVSAAVTAVVPASHVYS